MQSSNNNISPGSAFARMRRIVDIECTVCKKGFRGSVRTKYCSERCKQAAKFARQKAKQTKT